MSELTRKFAARLKHLIGKQQVIDLGSQSGPSRSYIYRMLKGETNPSLEEMDAVVRAYGSTLAEFFEPWREGRQLERAQLSAEARLRLERILVSDVDLNGLLEFLRVIDGDGRGRRSERK